VASPPIVELTSQVTPVFAVVLKVALSCKVRPVKTEAVEGEMVIADR